MGVNDRLVGLTMPAALNWTVRTLSPSRSYTYVNGTASDTHNRPRGVDGGSPDDRGHERHLRDPRRVRRGHCVG